VAKQEATLLPLVVALLLSQLLRPIAAAVLVYKAAYENPFLCIERFRSSYGLN
jgi:hypothetical protein